MSPRERVGERGPAVSHLHAEVVPGTDDKAPIGVSVDYKEPRPKPPGVRTKINI